MIALVAVGKIAPGVHMGSGNAPRTLHPPVEGVTVKGGVGVFGTDVGVTNTGVAVGRRTIAVGDDCGVTTGLGAQATKKSKRNPETRRSFLMLHPFELENLLLYYVTSRSDLLPIVNKDIRDFHALARTGTDNLSYQAFKCPTH